MSANDLARIHLEVGPALRDHVYLPAFKDGQLPLVIREIRNGVAELRPPRGRLGRVWYRDTSEFTEYDAERGGWRLAK